MKLKRKNRPNIYYVFDEEPAVSLLGDSVFIEEKHMKDFIDVDYREFDLESLNNSNVVCSSNLHCLLTKYLLDYHGVKKRFIYKIPLKN